MTPQRHACQGERLRHRDVIGQPAVKQTACNASSSSTLRTPRGVAVLQGGWWHLDSSTVPAQTEHTQACHHNTSTQPALESQHCANQHGTQHFVSNAGGDATAACHSVTNRAQHSLSQEIAGHVRPTGSRAPVAEAHLVLKPYCCSSRSCRARHKAHNSQHHIGTRHVRAPETNSFQAPQPCRHHDTNACGRTHSTASILANTYRCVAGLMLVLYVRRKEGALAHSTQHTVSCRQTVQAYHAGQVTSRQWCCHNPHIM